LSMVSSPKGDGLYGEIFWYCLLFFVLFFFCFFCCAVFFCLCFFCFLFFDFLSFFCFLLKKKIELFPVSFLFGIVCKGKGTSFPILKTPLPILPLHFLIVYFFHANKQEQTKTRINKQEQEQEQIEKN